MWDLPGPGLELVSPALAGGFLTTAPPGKSLVVCFYKTNLQTKPSTLLTLATGVGGENRVGNKIAFITFGFT